jgi:hypothetical protein
MVASLAAVRGSLGHNILYVAIGFVWLSFIDDAATKEKVNLPRAWRVRLPSRGAGVPCRIRG